MKLHGLCTVIAALAAVQSGFSQKSISPETERLAAVMQGSYSSEAQARRDTAYFDVRLRVARIWRRRTDAAWLYVEQALASMQGKPYRQRIYRLRQLSDSTFESAVFTLREPLRFAGEWRGENLLKNITPDSLTERQGCAVALLRKKDGTYTGGTTGTGCPSDLRGAAYATSEIVLYPDKMLTWDRGFDTSGRQAWGAMKGGYEFIKRTE